MRFTQLATVVLSTVMVAACADQLRPTAPDVAPRRTITPTTTNLVVRPSSVGIYGANNVVGVAGDAATGFSTGSLASNGAAKTDMYFTPSMLFGRDITLGEVATMSYFTKTGATHVVDTRDWYLAIYTKPYVGDVSTPNWYGDRIGAEPYFSNGINDPANTWNQWSTNGASNKLRFFESTAGALGANFGSYTDPDWSTFVASTALSGQPYASHAVLSFSVQTASAWAVGFIGQLDGLRITLTDGSVATVNFEPDPNWGACSVSMSGTTYTLLSDCIVDHTQLIPDGVTLDGDSHSITAIDPAGLHFLGAIVQNAGASANVRNLTVKASGLVNVCDDGVYRLRGILFQGAAGTISNNRVIDINQGPSGCQEGNAIEARNAPFAVGGPDLAVTIDANYVSGYIKNGITASGSVAAMITNNTVIGAGPVGVPLAAQNGIQIGFGATAVVTGNSVSGHNYTPKTWVACGLLIYQADGVRAFANSLFSNERDQCNIGKGGGTFNPTP